MFAVKFYTKAWTEAPNAAKAPLRDLWLLQAPEKHKDKEVAKAARSKLANHLWYLSEELVALALFDNDVPPKRRG